MTTMATDFSVPDDQSRRGIIIVVALVAAIGVGGFFYLLMKKSAAPTPAARLEGAIRPESPDFKTYQSQIALDPPEADESKRTLGDWWMNLHTTVRNLTGRTITGLEVHAAVVDHQNKPVKERTVVVIPGEMTELNPNKTFFVHIALDGMSDDDDRANIKMEVTAFKFK